MQTIGERLEEARKRKGISIREAAEGTKIRGDYLHKFENNQFDIRLPEIYVRGFLRNYAVYLKLSGDKISNDYLALGLGDQKNARPINREIYGRMDLSVASASKNAEDARPAPSPAAAAMAPGKESASSGSGGDNNPATFRPRGGGGAGFSIDPNLIIKGAALIGGVVVLVLLLIWGIGALTNKSSTPAAPAVAVDNSTWVKPQPGERTLGIVATASVDLITVTDSAGVVLYRGPLRTGENRAVPRTGIIFVTTDQPQNVSVQTENGGTLYSLKDPSTGQFMKRSKIGAP
ncbi:MAG: helix-turn-helix domain-containing protein [Opitutaceae bacterium]|jgi:transcriptional regulator with XRE-family HTH domain